MDNAKPIRSHLCDGLVRMRHYIRFPASIGPAARQSKHHHILLPLSNSGQYTQAPNPGSSAPSMFQKTGPQTLSRLKSRLYRSFVSKEEAAYHASTSPLTPFVRDRSTVSICYHLELPDVLIRQWMLQSVLSWIFDYTLDLCG